MVVVELVLRHTRHTSPTRRVAVERFSFPEAGAPHAAGVLLAGVAVAHLRAIEPALLERYDELLADLEKGVPMPRRALRHRVQTDCIGLDSSPHRLVTLGEVVRLDVDHHGPALPQVVGALAGADSLRGARRRFAIELMRRAREMRWTSASEVAAALLAGTEPLRIPPNGSRPRLGKREERALRVLGFASHERPTRVEVMAAFRRLARETHPDHGGVVAGAGQRMAELSSARELLLRHVPSV